MVTFQRARSAEQRSERRQSILATAAAMLEEMPVTALSLNELSRRVGLAKSNVVRYFETREAVLLDLLEHAARQFLLDISDALPSSVDASAPVLKRSRAVAACLASAFEAHPMLCELISAQPGVLEHNVSAEVAIRYKRGARDNLVGLADVLQRVLPELGAPGSTRAARMTVILVGAMWTQSHPAPTVRAALDSDPNLSFFLVSFPDALASALATFLAGLLAMNAADAPAAMTE